MPQARELTYRGKSYPSVSALASELELKRSTLSVALNKFPDASVEDVVANLRGENKPTLATINGVEYKSLNSLSKATGVCSAIIKRRVEHEGMSYEEACTTPVKSREKPITYDGVEYASISALMRAYGLDLDTYNRRRRIGWTLDEIVNTPLYEKAPGKAKSVTYRGETYQSLADFARAFDVCYSTFLRRYNQGYSLQDCVKDYMLDDDGNMIKYE
jgi:hypothetical protein